MIGAVYQSKSYQDLIIYAYTTVLIILYYKHKQNKLNDNYDAKEKIEEDNKYMSILNDFIYQMSSQSGMLILKMEYQRNEGESEMKSQEVKKFDCLAKKLLKADDVAKMLERFQNSEFELVDESNNKNEDLVDINQIKKPLDFWIRMAAAEFISQKDEQYKMEKQNLNQSGLNGLNPASSILNVNQNLKGKFDQLPQQKASINNSDLKKLNEQKETVKINVFQNYPGQQHNIGSALGLIGNSVNQNSTLPYNNNNNNNIQPNDNGINELSNIQSFQGININNNFNSNIANNQITSDDLFLNFNSPRSNGNLLQINTAKSKTKNEESTVNPSIQNQIEQNYNIQQAYLSFKKGNEQKENNNIQNILKNLKEDPLNDVKIAKSTHSEIKGHHHHHHIKQKMKNGDGELDKSEIVDKNEVILSKSNIKIHSKQDLTAQDDKENEENLIQYKPKKNFTIKQYKGVLFIRKKAEVFRRVTIGSFMEGDDIFVLLSIQKDSQKQEKKINQLRDLLDQYESLYLKSLKCLKNLTYDAYLDIPTIENEEKLKNNFETIINKNFSLNLQLKIIMNKIINLKDILLLQKPIKRMTQVEVIDIVDLINELKNDFRSLLEEKNATIQVKNPQNITTIINSPKRVKQALFNLLHNAINNIENNFFVQIIINYYQENNKIIQFHIINKIKNMPILTSDDTKLDIKEILKGIKKIPNKKSKTQKGRAKNNLQIGLRISYKILTLIGPKHNLTTKTVHNTFHTQFHIYSDATQETRNDRLIKKDKEQKIKEAEEVINKFQLYFYFKFKFKRKK